MKLKIASYFKPLAVSAMAFSILLPSFLGLVQQPAHAQNIQIISEAKKKVDINKRVDFSSFVKNVIFNEFNKEWRNIRIKVYGTWEVVGELGISKEVEDLTIEDDSIYTVNKQYVEGQIAKNRKLKEHIDKILSDVNNSVIDITTVDPQYKKYIEVEEEINNADYVYVMALPLDKFLIKEDADWKQHIVITRKPEIIFENEDLKNDPALKETIEEEIKDIQSSLDIEEMRSKMENIQQKFHRDYSPLFIFKEMNLFFEQFEVKVAFRDNVYTQNYGYRNKEYMHSLYYVPTKLKTLDKLRSKYFMIYIPISYKRDINNLLRGLSNQKSIYKSSPEFCFSMKYDDKYNYFNNLFCGLESTFNSSSNVFVQPAKVYHKNTFFINLDKLGLLSIVGIVFVVLIAMIIPYFVFKYVDKILKYSSKLETESI